MTPRETDERRDGDQRRQRNDRYRNLRNRGSGRENQDTNRGNRGGENRREDRTGDRHEIRRGGRRQQRQHNPQRWDEDTHIYEGENRRRPGSETGTWQGESPVSRPQRSTYDRDEHREGRRSDRGRTDRNPRGGRQAGSQRGSQREDGISGRVGGQRGESGTDRGAPSSRRETDHTGNFGGERGFDERDRRYGSRHGHGSQREERY